jgi:hypothetical protein
MIKGTYIFYENGQEILRSSNVITKFGKRFLTNLIAGNVNFDKKDIALGIGETSATVNDTRLEFETYRLPVIFGSTDIQTSEGVTTYSVIYKTTLPVDVAGRITEVGLYPSTRSSIINFDSKFISDFNSYLEWFDESGLHPDVDPDYARIGNDLVLMQSNSGEAQEYISNVPGIDISGYGVSDTFQLAYYKYDTNLNSIQIRFYSSDTDYYYFTPTVASGTGYKLSSDIPLSELITSGSPDKRSIVKIGVVLTPTGSTTTEVGMDGLRVNDEDTFDPIFGIISRSILLDSLGNPNPLNKIAGRQVDIEYKLDIGF